MGRCAAGSARELQATLCSTSGDLVGRHCDYRTSQREGDWQASLFAHPWNPLSGVQGCRASLAFHRGCLRA
jgi:hypothetical protein